MLTPTTVLYPPLCGDELPVAVLDWATGIMQLFIPLDEWQAVINTDPTTLDEDGRYTLEALQHESTHLLQLTTTGFGYDIAHRLFKCVAAAARDHVALDVVLEHRAEYAEEVVEIYARLARTGAEGISPITILESAAFHAQKLGHYPGLGPKGFEHLLDTDAPSGDYRHAYDVAVEHLGTDAFEQFPHVANLALSVEEPEVAFPALLEAFRSRASRTDIYANHELGRSVLNDRFADILLGSASDRLWGGYAHPILQRIVLTYNKLANEGRLDPITLTARGRVYDDELARLLLGPISFPPTEGSGGVAPMWVPAHWPQTAANDPLLDLPLLRLLSAIARILQMDVEPIEPAPLQPRPQSPIATAYDVPVILRNWVFTHENRTHETAAHFGNLLREIATDSAKTRAVRGTVAITFPDEEFPGDSSPLVDDSVQTFLRQLFEHVPHLLYFLADSSPLAGPTLAVAAFRPNSLTFDGDRVGLLTTSEALYAIAILVGNAARFARDHGEEPAVVFGHLRPFDPSTRSELESLLLNA